MIPFSKVNDYVVLNKRYKIVDWRLKEQSKQQGTSERPPKKHQRVGSRGASIETRCC